MHKVKGFMLVSLGVQRTCTAQAITLTLPSSSSQHTASSAALPCTMAWYTSQLTPHWSAGTRHTSHVTRHTSHVTRHTSHVTSTCGCSAVAASHAEARMFCKLTLDVSVANSNRGFRLENSDAENYLQSLCSQKLFVLRDVSAHKVTVFHSQNSNTHSLSMSSMRLALRRSISSSSETCTR